jgi:site-specific recombinase XerC
MALTRHGRVRVTFRVHGKQHEHHFPAHASKRERQKWIERERTRLSDDLPVATSGTLAGDVERYLATLAHRPRLKAERAHDLKFWVARFGTQPRHTLKAADLSAALSELRTTKAAATCNHKRIALSHLWSTLDGRRAPNLLRDVPGFDEPEPEPRDLPDYLIDRILAQMTLERGPKGEKRPHQTKARLRVIADTGLTPAQMKRLQPDDLHLDASWVYVRRRLKGKGVKGSPKPLTAAGVAALRAFVAAKAFGEWSVQGANKTWRLACRKAALLKETTKDERAIIERARLYDLRHSFGTKVFRATGSLHTTGELLDHRSQKTTRRYALGAIPAHLRAAVETINAGSISSRDDKSPE